MTTAMLDSTHDRPRGWVDDAVRLIDVLWVDPPSGRIVAAYEVLRQWRERGISGTAPAY